MAVFADRLAYAGRQAWLAGEPDAARDAFALAKGLSARPKSTGLPLYSAAEALVGLERAARWSSRAPQLAKRLRAR